MEKENNKLKILLLVVVVVISFIGGLFFSKVFLGDNSSEPTEEEKKEDPKDEPKDDKISDELLNELKEIAQIDNEAAPTNYFTPLLKNDGLLSDYGNELRTRIVYLYANKHYTTTKVTGDDYSICGGGSGYCTGVKVEDFNKAAKKYGYSEFVPNPNNEYEGMYLFGYGGDVTKYSKTIHNITSKKDGEDIILTDNLTYVSEFEGVEDSSEIKTFTFKKSSDGEYYLYSVGTKYEKYE